MRELIAFLLPPAVALAGMRINGLLFGKEWESRLGAGLKFAMGLAVGMLAFSQAALLGALAGINPAGGLAWLALVWGAVEAVLRLIRAAPGIKRIQPRLGHLWLLLLLPVLYCWWVFGRLSTLEGTLEFDAVAFWVFKAKVLYLEQGKNLLYWMHQPDLAYAHWDYPMLVPCLYVLGYGAVGGVNEFVNKVWPFWMVVALCLGILSLAKVGKRPHPLPVAAVVVFCFLPASLYFVRQEGGTMPMVFFTSLTAILAVKAISSSEAMYLAAALLAAAGAAMTKFDGIVYLTVWFFALLPIGWRRGWLRDRRIRNSIVMAVGCWLPYVWFRLEKPIPHPESGWMRAGLASSAAALHRFPQAWFLNVLGRFFGGDFFHWVSTDHNQLQWAGKWAGLASFVNEQLYVLPWLSVGLLALSWWKGRDRTSLAILTVVIGMVLTLLCLVIVCIPKMQADLGNVIEFSGRDAVGRYFFPFFCAWYFGIVSTWFEVPHPS